MIMRQWQVCDRNDKLRILVCYQPTVEVISSDVVAGARGSYDDSTNRIYLADSFVANGTPEAITTVLLKQIAYFFMKPFDRLNFCSKTNLLFLLK